MAVYRLIYHYAASMIERSNSPCDVKSQAVRTAITRDPNSQFVMRVRGAWPDAAELSELDCA
jgi:hypothetical protein